MHKCVPVVNHEQYVMLPDETIIGPDGSTVEPFGPDDDRKVMLDNTVCRLASLSAATYIGVAPFYVVLDRRGVATYVIPKVEYLDEQTILMDGVVFKKIPHHSRYAISENAIVFDIQRHIFIRHHLNERGYHCVGVICDDDNTRHIRKVHRLVYMTYRGEIPEDMVVDHRDNNRHHNQLSNLQLLSIQDNVRKSFVEGAAVAVWSEEQIHTICKALADNTPVYKIAELVGYDYYANRPRFNHLIFRLRNGVGYRDISSQYEIGNYNPALSKPDAKFTEDQVRAIAQALSEGARVKDLANEYHVATITIANIRDGATWRHVTGGPVQIAASRRAKFRD